jgi:chemotaxis response regulator CheB
MGWSGKNSNPLIEVVASTALYLQAVGWYWMKGKRVLLVESGRFIGGVIHRLFALEDKLTVREVRPCSPRELLRAVSEYQPDVVVMDDTQQVSYLNYLLCSLQNCAALRIVVVNANSNQVEVYYKQKVPVMNTADLFAVIQ